MLAAIENLGGTAKPKDVYPLVAAQFPELSPEEQTQTLESTPPSVRKWWNMVQWVRQHLVEVGELDGSTRGVWKITDAGRARLKREGHRPTKPGQQDRDINIRDLATANRDEVKRRLLTELKNLSPVQFEHFCSVLLQQLGFQSLTVTRRSGDGGIDGHGISIDCWDIHRRNAAVISLRLLAVVGELHRLDVALKSTDRLVAPYLSPVTGHDERLLQTLTGPERDLAKADLVRRDVCEHARPHEQKR